MGAVRVQGRAGGARVEVCIAKELQGPHSNARVMCTCVYFCVGIDHRETANYTLGF